MLEAEGYDVQLAHDGRQVLEVSGADRPDVILLDLTLPVMSGLEVARELRRSERSAKTAIVSASGHSADRVPDPFPFAGHLVKPVGHDRLFALYADLTAGDWPA